MKRVINKFTFKINSSFCITLILFYQYDSSVIYTQKKYMMEIDKDQIIKTVTKIYYSKLKPKILKDLLPELENVKMKSKKKQWRLLYKSLYTQ